MLVNMKQFTTCLKLARHSQQLSRIYRRNVMSNAQLNRKPSFLLGVGNPILDYSVHTEDESVIPLLNVLNAEPHIQQLLQDENKEVVKAFRQIVKGTYSYVSTESSGVTSKSNRDDALVNAQVNKTDITLSKPTVTPGGATQNTVRTAQWCLGKQRKTGFVGCVGKDSTATEMKSIIEKSSVVELNYEVHPTQPTAQCLSIISPSSRTLISRLGAAKMLTLDFLTEARMEEMIDRATIIYISGYLWQSSPDIVLRLASVCLNRPDKSLALNLHSPAVCRLLSDPEFEPVLASLDYLFGSAADALEMSCQLANNASQPKVRSRFAEFLNLPVASPDLVERAAIYLCQLDKADTKRPRCVVFTQGAHGTVLAARGNQVIRCAVLPLSKDKVVDTAGCGDALTGGFLAQVGLNGAPLQSGLSCGVYAARTVAMETGLYFPKQFGQYKMRSGRSADGPVAY